MHGDRRSALLALIANPLIGDLSVTDDLLAEVLAINKARLPQFA